MRTMGSILGKFPRTVAEKWVEHLSTQSTQTKLQPFQAFVNWLGERKEVWQQMVVAQMSVDGDEFCMFGGGDSGDDRNNGGDVTLRKCFGCGKTGHIRRDCPDKKRQKQPPSHTPKSRPPTQVKLFWCALHKGEPGRMCYSESCQGLRKVNADERVKLLKENKDCEHCCGDHLSSNCQRANRVCGGGKSNRGCAKNHNLHELFCVQAKVFAVHSLAANGDVSTVILLLMNVQTAKKNVSSVVFFDSGCTSNFIRDEFAKICGFRGEEKTLSVTTLGGVVNDYKRVIEYHCQLRDVNGVFREFTAYGMNNITGDVSKIGSEKLKRLFPYTSKETLRQVERGSTVDVLIGLGHPSWHPERVEKAPGDGDFWIYRGIFGMCVGGRHPNVREDTRRNQCLFHVTHEFCGLIQQTLPSVSHELEFCPRRIYGPMKKEENQVRSALRPEATVFVPNQTTQVMSVDEVEEGSVTGILDTVVSEVVVSNTQRKESTKNEVVCSVCCATFTSPFTNENLFFEAEALGTKVEPLCGACKCSKCPVPGSLYTFQEQREYDVINDNLFRKGDEKRWYTPYPWKTGRDALPKNEKSAYKSLLSLERIAAANPEKGKALREQVNEMISSGTAIPISPEKLNAWKGPYHFLPIVLVKGKKRYRVCFDAARSQCGFPPFNKHLYKGPDRFLNDLLGVLLGFRNGRVGAVADLSKFHNQVFLVEEDVFMQLFYWRENPTLTAQVFAVRCNNFGVVSANCIATCALRKSADRFASVYPAESEDVKKQTYVDDALVADLGDKEIRVKTERIDEICADAGMRNKGWVYSGELTADLSICGDAGEDNMVLGIGWSPGPDEFVFRVTLHFKIGDEDVDVASLLEFDAIKDVILTRRVLSSNIARIFDPVGFLCPVLLKGKLLMRELWSYKELGWDDSIPAEIASKWICFLRSLLKLSEVRFPRSLWPKDEVVGLPTLIIFSDGSASAFGAAAYIRWKLTDGTYWSRLIMAKCKIAPKDILSIPRMEINGSVVGNRMKMFLLKETNLEFETVYQFVDSSTVLGYVQKEYGVFDPYEGIRIAEIQSTNVFVGEQLKGWGWVPGEHNPADWCTKPREVEELYEGGFWECGPEFLRQEKSQWPIKFTFKKDLDGMRKKITVDCHFLQLNLMEHYIQKIVSKCGSWKKMVRVLAWWLRVLVNKGTFASDVLVAKELELSKNLLLKFAQRDIAHQLKQAVSGKGPYRKLAPCEDKSTGLIRVGNRMKIHVPFTFDHKLPVIIPYQHRITKLIMREAHQFSHSGQDGTLSRFRSSGYWTTRGGQLAKKMKHECIPCRKEDRKTIQQPMGDLPEERLNQLVAWACCQLDLFGPFNCRSDINTRSKKKTWGLIIEDSNSGAVYIDIVQDYSASAVLLTLKRFGALRGWPGVVSTDPGSQLESASGILERWWKTMERTLREFGSSKNFQWKISPADSPWRQGKAERRIGVVKKLLRLSIGDSILTPVELQTTFFEISNICNERPLGLSKPREDGSYVLITPNQLMLGRSSNIVPDDANIAENLPFRDRYRMVKHVSDAFWHRWCTYVSPALVVRQRWHEKSRNLQMGDLVMICDSSKIKSKYKLGIVDDITVSDDGVVRSTTVRYCNIQSNPNGEDRVSVVRVTRSVQRLVLIMPVEEMSSPVNVEEHEQCVKCVVRCESGGVEI